MKRPRHCVLRYLKPVVCLLVLPPLVWVVVLAVVPTECARRTVAERLAQASGRSVTLGKVRVGLLGGLQLENLAIGAPDSTTDPWLKVASASIDVCLAQLLFGTIDPTEVTLEDVDLRILRRPDGRLELADFLHADSDRATPRSSTTRTSAAGPTGLTIRVRGGRVVVMDAPTATRLEFRDVEGQGSCTGAQVNVSELRGTLNGGTVRLAAQLDRGGPEPAFEGQIRAQDVTLGEGMMALEYFVPVLAGTPAKLAGRLSLNLYLRGRGDSRDEVRTSLVGHGDVNLDPVDLEGSRLLAALKSLVECPRSDHVGTIHSAVAIKGGRIVSDNLAIDLGRVPFALKGWTDFDGRLDYRLKSDGLAERIQGKAKDILSELRVDVNDLGAVRMRGTFDRVEVTVNGSLIGERGRLREIGRRVWEKTMR